MNNTVYLVSTSSLKDFSIVNSNVADELLSNAILEAQEIDLCQILGSKLYKKIIELVKTNTIDAATDYKFLLDEYCLKVIIYAATSRAAVYTHFKVMNKGVQLQNSDNSNPVSLDELEYLRNQIKNDLEFFEKRLQDFLITNKDLYPEYELCSCDGELNPQQNVYRTSLVIPNHRAPKYNYNDVK